MANVLGNCIFHYARLSKPELMYEREETDNPMENKQYVIDAIVPAKTYNGLKKTFKNVKMLKEAKTYTAKEYEEIYKVAPPEGEEWLLDGEYVRLKFTNKAWYMKSGDATKPPRLVGSVKTGSGTASANGIDIIAKDTEVDGETIFATGVGNGSTGKLCFKPREFEHKNKKGLCLDLSGVQIINLVEYVMEEDEDEFDYDEGNDDEFGGTGDSFGDDATTTASDNASDDDDDEWD
jgi:hypothetical protein